VPSVAAFVQVSLYIAAPELDGRWSDPIPGIGGSMLLAKESNGVHHSDECFKMAL
jgi:hypothetical protein